MITIPTDAIGAAVMQTARDVATSHIVQSAIGTILGITILAAAPAVISAVIQAPTDAWNYFRKPAAPIIDGTKA